MTIRNELGLNIHDDGSLDIPELPWCYSTYINVAESLKLPSDLGTHKSVAFHAFALCLGRSARISLPLANQICYYIFSYFDKMDKT